MLSPAAMLHSPAAMLHCHLMATMLIAVSSANAAENYVILGDSLSKEYQVEFPALFPLRPSAWDERNWIELLSTHRSERVDIGSFGVWPDSRLTGHRFNWAFPGSQTSEWVDILEASILREPEKYFLRLTLEAHLEEEADRVVIFLGGNDLKNNYGTFYNGADPQPFIDALVSNVTGIVDFVIDKNDDLEIVLVNMPDVGITPEVISARPDPEKRALVTELTREVNRRLEDLANVRGIGYADIFALTRTLAGEKAFVIGGIRFEKSVDPGATTNGSTYLFSPDGFHPNTNAQLLFADEIVEAFRRAYPDSPPVQAFSSEEKLRLLELDPDVSFSAWAAAYELPDLQPEEDGDGDGLSAFEEFALDGDPRKSENDVGPWGVWREGAFSFRYQRRLAVSDHFTARPQMSVDLREWSELEEEEIIDLGGNIFGSSPTPAGAGARFLRLLVRGGS